MARMNRIKQQNGTRIADIEMSVPAPEAPEEQSRGLRERALLVRSAVSRWYGTGADRTVVQELRDAKNATGDIGEFRKRFMSKDRLKRIDAVTAEWRDYHRQHTLPWGEGNGAARLLSIEGFFAYKKRAAQAERDFYLAVEELLSNWAEAVREQRRRLGDLWRASDYPTVDELRERFKFRVLVEPIPMSDDFRLKLSNEENEEIRRAYDAEVTMRLKDAVQDVYARIGEVVTELRDKLDNSDASLRTGSFTSLRELVATLPELNAVVRDPNVAALGNKIAKDLLAVEAVAMNEDSTLRNDVKSKADKLLAALKPLQSSFLNQETLQ